MKRFFLNRGEKGIPRKIPFWAKKRMNLGFRDQGNGSLIP